MELIPLRDPRSAHLNFRYSRVRGVPLAGEALGFGESLSLNLPEIFFDQFNDGVPWV